MAGGGSLGRPEKAKRGKHSKRKKKKRIGFHLDMTPLVDITFLLLTFFMFTTTMLKPQVMEMKIPPESNIKIDVIDRELLSLVLQEDGSVLWYVGSIDPKVNPDNKPKKIDLNKIKDLAIEQNLKATVKNRLITFLKIDEKVKYEYVIAVLDELNQAEGVITQEIAKDTQPGTNGQLVPVERKRKFTLAPLTEKDKEEIKNAGGGQ